MIKVRVLYRNGDPATFDIDYYCTNTSPVVQISEVKSEPFGTKRV